MFPTVPTRVCTRCQVRKPVSDFAVRTRRFTLKTKHRLTRWPWCRPCKAEYSRERRRKGLDRDNQHARYLRHPEERKARATVSRAIRTGKLTRPDQCQQCGHQGRIEAHHKSYEREHWLAVEWLCSVCHAARRGEWERLMTPEQIRRHFPEAA